jgi:hypothetical protein
MRRPAVPHVGPIVGPVVVAIVVPLVVTGAAAGAQPADTAPERELPPALEAAFGSPPADAPPPQGSIDPGYTEQGRDDTPDQIYGSTATTVGPDGTLVQGLQLTDPNLLQEYRNDIGVPEFHVVQTGDTLWDISEYYLSDPYLWPKLWSWNDHVTNAHWIFPGDRIRLYDPFAPQSPDLRGTDEPTLEFSKTRVPRRVGEDPVLLTRTAFVDAEQFESAMTVIGGGEANVMMSTLDTVYLDYDKANPPIPGERLVVYAPQEKIYDLEGKKVLGYVVEVMGDVEIETIARKAVEGTVASSINPIERGYKVGALRRRFDRVDPVPADRAASGLVVATLNDTGPIPIKKARKIREQKGKGENDVLAGETQLVVVSLGQTDGVEVGNVLEVVRKGDEYTPKRNIHIPYEDGWPRRVIGALVVVQVLPSTSLAVSTYSRREFERGDHVELRGPGLRRDGTQADPGPGDTRQGKTIDAQGNVRRDDGKAEGKVKVKIGG